MKEFKISTIEPVNSKFIAKIKDEGFTLECYLDVDSPSFMIGIACSRIELYNLYNVLRKEFKDLDPNIAEQAYWKIERKLDALLNDVLGLSEINFVCNNEDLYGLFNQLKEIFK